MTVLVDVAVTPLGRRPRFLSEGRMNPASLNPWHTSFLTMAHPLETIEARYRARLTEEDQAPAEDRSFDAAIKLNGWDPRCPPPLKAGHYLSAPELFYYTVRCIKQGGIDKSGKDGQRFVELVYLLAQHFLGRIAFSNQGQMSNMAEDLIQEAATKCCLVVDRFDPWSKPDPKKPNQKLNNAFAFFTTIIRHRMLETLGSALQGSKVYLEDLKAENQSIGDLI
jgi:hypothetical protein